MKKEGGGGQNRGTHKKIRIGGHLILQCFISVMKGKKKNGEGGGIFGGKNRGEKGL